MRKLTLSVSVIAFLAAVALSAQPTAEASGSRVGTAKELTAERTRVAPMDTCTTCWIYTYDGAGNISTAGPDSFTYDTVGRLITGTAGGAANGVTYQYDAFGNRTAATPITGAAKCVGNTDCDVAITVNAATNHITNTGTTYDAAGNMTALNAGASFTYDALAMAKSAQLGSTTLQYIYTADDERVAVYDGGLWTWTIRDLGAHPLSEYTSLDAGGSYGTSSLTWSRNYVWRGSALLAAEARRSFSDAAVVSEHFHLDHLGTARLVTDDSGNRLGLHAYYPYGGEVDLLPSEQPEAELKFTGHARDTGRGGGPSLDYMHARYYSANLGRFLSVDPALPLKTTVSHPQLWNRYTYSIDNPVNGTDPDGRCVLGPQLCVSLTMGLGKFMWAAYVGFMNAAEHSPGADIYYGNQYGDSSRVIRGQTAISAMAMGNVMMLHLEAPAVESDAVEETEADVVSAGSAPSVNVGSGSKPIPGMVNVDNLADSLHAPDMTVLRGVRGVNADGLSAFGTNSVGNVTGQNLPSVMLGMGGRQFASDLGRTMRSGSTLSITTQTPGVLKSFAQLLGGSFKDIKIQGGLLTAVRK